MMRLPPLFLLLATAGCAGTGNLAALQAPTPTFDPVAFFTGHTHGDGMLTLPMSAAKPTLVEGHGHMEGATLVLDQRVKRADKPATTREWRLHAVGSGHWAGTLSDATGPVIGTVEGNRFHVRFTLKHAMTAEQWMYLQPGGAALINRLVVRKFGVPVAHLNETITHLPS